MSSQQTRLYRVSLTTSCNPPLCASYSTKARLASLFQIPSSRRYSGTASCPTRSHETTRSWGSVSTSTAYLLAETLWWAVCRLYCSMMMVCFSGVYRRWLSWRRRTSSVTQLLPHNYPQLLLVLVEISIEHSVSYNDRESAPVIMYSLQLRMTYVMCWLWYKDSTIGRSLDYN